MSIALHAAAFNLFAALSCGALIGSERQVRQRMAGLRTNALVALGAAGFVTFSQLMPGTDTCLTRGCGAGCVGQRLSGRRHHLSWRV